MDRINILLADDDDDDRQFFKEAFEEMKIQTNVTMVNDGVQLMTHLSREENPVPHILFLDLNMPRKSGLDCLQEIKQKALYNEMAIAIYSTSASEKDIEETFVQGANVYIKKPNDFNTLKKILEEVISINWQYHTSSLNRDNYFFSL
jgi:CheY-like chemotaxis protein